MRRLRLCVIGAGSWVNASHLPTLATRGDVDFVGVCRLGAEPLQEMKTRWGFQVASEDPADVLSLEPDMVIVASPSALHADHAAAALTAGAHVLVEKPFTLTPEDAWGLVHRAEQVGREIVVSFGYNFKPIVVEAAELLQTEGGVGDIESVLVSMSSGTRALLGKKGVYPKASGDFPPDPETWIDPRLAGGGYGQAQLSHALGAALHLVGLRGERVFAMTAPAGAPIELDSAMAVGYRGGAVGTVTGTSAHPGFLDERDQLNIRVMGDRGQLDVEFERDRISFHREGRTAERLLPRGSGSYDCIGPPNVLADIALGRETVNRAPGELGARTVEILAASYRSAASGLPASISEGTS